MFSTLYGKLAAVLVALLCSLGILYGVSTLYTTQVFLQEVNQRLNRDLARRLLVERNLTGGDNLDEAAVKGLFSYYMHINPAIEIYLLDREGNILAFEAPQQKIKRHRVDLGPVRQFLAGAEALPILGDDPRHETRRKVFSAAAIPFRGPVRQYLYVVLGGEEYDSARQLLQGSYFLQVSTSAVVASILFGVLAGLAVFHLLTRRLRRLTRVMDGFRDSGFRRHDPYGEERNEIRGDEIDRLGATFDQMAARIIEQVRALEEKDNLRRNLVANVSHDLRTPLASLQGYLETLLMKEGSLDGAQRQQYLDTAFRHSERLTHLVGELFELSKLDAKETQPDKEPLALGELVQDVAQKFRLRAAQGGIGLEADIEPGLPFVGADVRLLNRVLENLVENALVHTPQGGAVRLGLRRAGAGVAFHIANTGPGIAPEDLPHLFERFYQSPEKRHGGGAGLGLAIVKRILDLHGSEVQVHSRPGKETVFSFELSAWHGGS